MSPDGIIVGCVSKKKQGVWPARDLYSSPLWDRRRDYAVVSRLPWAIMSAKYGLIGPNEEISPYNRTIGDLQKDPSCLTTWRAELANQLEDLFGHGPGQYSRSAHVTVRDSSGLIGKTIEVHAGMDYIRELDLIARDLGFTIVYPLQGLGIGKQLQWYTTGGRGQKRVFRQPTQASMF